MTILFIVIAIAFTVFTAGWMIRPFLLSRHRQLNFEMLDEELRQIESLVSRKVALVQALRDTEYDWKTNKISEEDYRRFKKSCERQAVGVMRRLQALHGGDRDWDAVIDRAVQQRLEAIDADTSSAQVSETDPVDNAPPDADHTATCTGCEAPLDADDRFCSRCGQPVADTNPASDDFQSLCSPPRTSEVAG